MVNAAQLSLFDTATVIKSAYEVGDRVKLRKKPAYEVGDRVKLRKKPIAASYVKKGDVVEVAAVHPINGSIKFWNERSERWEFIHSDEIGHVVPDDSPTPAEVAVGESNCPHSGTDTIPSIDAVGESNCLHSEIDSPTPAEVAVGESIAPLGDSDYLDPISTYKPRGTARGNKDKQYYRLSYKEGNKVRQIHIRGGNTDSPIAQAKVQEVRSLLAAGMPPAEIALLLKKPI